MKIALGIFCLNFLLLFQHQISESDGGYEVLLTLNNYSNPDSECAFCRSGRGDCDRNTLCDNLFYFCLQTINSDSVTCPSNSLKSTVDSDAPSEVDFSTRPLQGLPNPLALAGITDTLGRVQIYIRVDDSDNRDDDLIDIFRINITGKSAINSAASITSSGIYGIATLSLSYQVTCTTGGNTCIDYCLDSCGPGTCSNMPSSSSYQCACPDGSNGINCNHCQGVNCGPGTCTNLQSTFMCNCPSTYSGSICNIDLCVGHCSNGGTCVRTQSGPSCNCPPTYSGSTCNIDLCDGHCLNGGTCVRTQSGPSCHCTQDFLEGNDGRCSEINHCFNISCNEGVCKSLRNNYTCMCPLNITGRNCELLNRCITNPPGCTTNGICINTRDLALCECNAGFTGPLCELVDTCYNINCNGGNCQRTINDYVCECPLGLTGRNCELNDYCYNVTCENGKCVNGKLSFLCDCFDGFTGEVCDINIDDCENITCSNDGICVDLIDSFSCQCINGFEGGLCEVEQTNRNFMIWIYASAGGAAIVLVLLILVTSLMVALIRTNRKADIKSNTRGNKSSLVIGDNPMYMMVKDSQQDDDEEERRFVNPIYGGPDISNELNLTSAYDSIPDTPLNILESTRYDTVSHSPPIKYMKPVDYEVPVESSTPSWSQRQPPLLYDESVTSSSPSQTSTKVLHKASPVTHEEHVSMNAPLQYEELLSTQVPQDYEIPTQTRGEETKPKAQDYEIPMQTREETKLKAKLQIITSSQRSLKDITTNSNKPPVKVRSKGGSQVPSANKKKPQKKPVLPPKSIKYQRKVTDGNSHS